MKGYKTGLFILLAIVLVFFLTGICFYPFLPETMATHWSGSAAEPDGYMSKFWGVFLLPILFTFLFLPTLALPYVIAIFLKARLFKLCCGFFILAMSCFLYCTYVLVLLYNIGVAVNIPKALLWSVLVLSVVVIGPIIMFVRRWAGGCEEEAKLEEFVSDESMAYSDSLVEIKENSIIFRNYYFPVGDKRVAFDQIESVRVLEPTMRNGKWRLHGSGDFKTWFPADYNRPKRDAIFIAKVRNKWWQIGFTVERSFMVRRIFSERGLLVGE